MRTRLAVGLLAGASVWSMVTAGMPAEATAPKSPAKISNVWYHSGPGAGQVTISWQSSGANTTSFSIETALTTFSKAKSSSLPWTGRHPHIFIVSGKKRSVTLSASQVASAGAAPGTGNNLFFRVSARNVSKSNATTREYGKLKAVSPMAIAPKKGTAMRIGTYNILSAKSGGGRRWLTRAPEVARTIASRSPAVIAIQELSPGRADGKSGGTTASMPRQTESLVTALKKKGAGRYKLVQSQSYVLPGTKHGSQGARILYDSNKVTLLSKCPNMTKTRHYNKSCSFDLPLGAGQPRTERRSAAFAEFKYKSTGKKFLFISVHLDHRTSKSLGTQKRYNLTRYHQMQAVYNKMWKIRHSKEPVIIAGDYNSWQNQPAGDGPHEWLAGHGFYDTSSAKTKVNFQYNTYNNLWRTMVASPQYVGNRIDTIMVRGARGSKRYENVMDRVDSTRASDHNMVVTDFGI